MEAILAHCPTTGDPFYAVWDGFGTWAHRLRRSAVRRCRGSSARSGTANSAWFVTLGTYSGEAFAAEREWANLRLLSGRNVVELVLEHYERLAEPWKARIPLRSVYAVDRGADGS